MCIRDRHIRDIKHITVLTNSIFVLNELIDTDVRLFVLGGCVNSSEYDMEGHLPVEALKHFCVDVAFICAGGITMENGVSDYNCEVAQDVYKRQAWHREVRDIFRLMEDWLLKYVRQP